MIRLQGGDTAALEVLYHRYAERLMGFLYRMVDGDRAKAEDLLQDVFVRLATTSSAFDPTRSFRPWVFTIATNLARNAQRYQSAREADSLNTLEHESSGTDVEHWIDSLDLPSFHSLLNETLREIAPDKRTAFLLRYQEHLSLAEIAEIQDCATGTVKSRIFYTLRYLETALTMYRPQRQPS